MLRLQGLYPGCDPLQSPGGLDLATTRSPLALSTPAGLSPTTVVDAFAPPSTHDLPYRTLTVLSLAGLQRILVPDPTTCPQAAFPFELLDLPFHEFSEDPPLRD